MNMKIPNGCTFVVGDPNPNFYLHQAMAELFPNNLNPNKEAMLTITSAEEPDKSIEFLKARDFKDQAPLNDEQLQLCTWVGESIAEYFSKPNPDKSAIFVYLACECLDPDEGYHWSETDTAFSALKELVRMGMGAYAYAERQLIQQTYIDPRFAVLKLAADCKRYSLKRLRMTAMGVDVMWSSEPYPLLEKFDNERFIPATTGYYGIVKGGHSNG